MKLYYTGIQGFQKGMIDAVKQDVSFEQQGMQDSVLWVENLTPNVILGSLVRRAACIHTAVPDELTIPAFEGVPGRDEQSVNLSLFCETSGSYNPIDSLYTANEIFTVAPFPQRIISVWHRHDWDDSQGVKIISYYGIEEVSGMDTFQRWQWREPHTDERVYPGMKVYGRLTDWTQYAQVFLFCTYPEKTVLDDDSIALSPVYTYYFEDRRYLHDGTTQYFNGIDFGTPDYKDTQVWKVKERFDLAEHVNILWSLTGDLPQEKTLDLQLSINETKAIQTLEAGKTPLESVLSPYFGDSLPDDFDDDVYTRQLVARVHFNHNGVPETVNKVSRPYCPGMNTYLEGTWSATPVGDLLLPQDDFVQTDAQWKSRTFWNAHWVNYREQRTPRRWCRNEVVPYAITAVVDGIERLIKKGKYTTPVPTGIDPEMIGFGTVACGKHFIVDNATSTKDVVNMQDVLFEQIWTYNEQFIEGYINYYPCLVNPYLTFRLSLSHTGSLTDLLGKIPVGLTEFRLYVSQPSALENEGNIRFSYSFPYAERSGSAVYRNTDIINNITYAPDDIYRWPRVKNDDDNEYCLVKRFLVQGESSNEPASSIKEFDRSVQGISLVATNGWTASESSGTTYLECAGTTGDPSFYLWDYPLEAPTLTNNLRTALVEWKGKGARLITNIKGRTFLAGTLDEKGKEEQGIIRYSLAQNGVMSTEVFSDLSRLQLARMPFTALLNYREQLWAFGRFELHRVQFPDLLDENSWEVLEKIEGQGTWNPRTATVTPHGVIWANENGVWKSDGRFPENIALAILQTYKHYALGKTNLYGLAYEPFYSPLTGFLEVTYNNVLDEIVLTVPVNEFFQEVRLIYSFAYENWRAEVQHTPATQCNRTHRQRWSSDNFYFGRMYGRNFSVAKQYFHSEEADQWLNGDTVTVQYFNVRLLTHEFGNGIDDSLLRKVLLEANPIDVEATYNAANSIANPSATLNALKDPQLSLEMRNIVSGDLPGSSASSFEIVQPNVKGGRFWRSELSTPSAGAYQRESYVLNIPFGKSFRRSRLHLYGRNIAHLRSLVLQLATFERKTYG